MDNFKVNFRKNLLGSCQAIYLSLGRHKTVKFVRYETERLSERYLFTKIRYSLLVKTIFQDLTWNSNKLNFCFLVENRGLNSQKLLVLIMNY